MWPGGGLCLYDLLSRWGGLALRRESRHVRLSLGRSIGRGAGLYLLLILTDMSMGLAVKGEVVTMPSMPVAA